MCRRCYDQGQHLDYVALGKQVVVATSTRVVPAGTVEGVNFVGRDVVNVVEAHRDQGRHCFLFGGGVLVQSFLAADAVDMLTVGVVPVLLGGGRPLFLGDHRALKLRLEDYAVERLQLQPA